MRFIPSILTKKSGLTRTRSRHSRRDVRQRPPSEHKLTFEPLEDRCLLSTLGGDSATNHPPVVTKMHDEDANTARLAMDAVRCLHLARMAQLREKTEKQGFTSPERQEPAGAARTPCFGVEESE